MSGDTKHHDPRAPAPLGATDLPELENLVSDDAAANVRSGLGKMDVLASPSRTKWEVSEFDA